MLALGWWLHIALAVVFGIFVGALQFGGWFLCTRVVGFWYEFGGWISVFCCWLFPRV